MKAILKFDLSNRDDSMAHLRCVNSEKMAIILFDIIFNLKKRIEHKLPEIDEKILDTIFEEIDSITEGLNIEELIN